MRINRYIAKKYILSFLVMQVMPAISCQAQRSLRILFCVKSFPCHTSWFILNQMTEFIKQGHEVTILTRDVSTISMNNAHPDIVTYNLLAHTYTGQLPCDTRTFDVILCQFSSLAPFIIEFKEQYKIKGALIVFVRGVFCYRKSHHEQIRKKIFAATDMFLPVCNYSKHQLVRLGCDPKKVSVIHSTIDCQKFKYKKRVMPPDNKIKIVTTSRLTPQKGLEYAIQAVARAIKKYPMMEYHIIGDGPLKNKLQKLIDTLHLGHAIKLLGWKSPEEVMHLLGESHIFLHPSVTTESGGQEGIPTSIMEAMATGLPVISTYHAGIPELVQDGISGFLVAEKDVDELAKKICYLIAHPHVCVTMGYVGRQRVEENFSKEQENKKLIDICLQLAA